MSGLVHPWRNGRPSAVHPLLPADLEYRSMNNHTWFLPPCRICLKFTAAWQPFGIGARSRFLFRTRTYPVAPTVSPAAPSACRQLHAIDGRFAEPSQYAPQYLLSGAAGQLQPGCAHFSIFFSAIETPLAPFSVAEKHTPTLTQNQSPRSN